MPGMFGATPERIEAHFLGVLCAESLLGGCALEVVRAELARERAQRVGDGARWFADRPTTLSRPSVPSVELHACAGEVLEAIRGMSSYLAWRKAVDAATGADVLGFLGVELMDPAFARTRPEFLGASAGVLLRMTAEAGETFDLDVRAALNPVTAYILPEPRDLGEERPRIALVLDGLRRVVQRLWGAGREDGAGG